jgi:hypothetical protein
LFRLYPILPRIWYVRGKLAEAAELLDGAIEAGRLLGSPPHSPGTSSTAPSSLLPSAISTSHSPPQRRASSSRTTSTTASLPPGPRVRLAGVLLESGHPDRAVELLLGRAGGEELTLIPGGWKVYCLELLTRCWLALERRSEAEHAAALAEVAAAAVRLPLAAAWADRAAAAAALHSGDTARAIERALSSTDAAQQLGAPIEAALSRTLAGRALAQPAGATGPSQSFSTQQLRSTPAVHCATARAPSES